LRKLIVLAVLACLSATTATALAATRTVAVGDNWYVKASPNNPTVSVKRGDTVVWRFRGQAPHNVAVTKGPARFRSPIKRSGTYSKRVTRAGTYTIICTIHGAADQRMTLRVR
jgi:plastocyanin